MILPRSKNTKRKRNSFLNTSEAFSLWEMLNSKYTSLEKLSIWNNYTHDKDLELYIRIYSSVIKGFIKTLEKALTNYGIKGPDTHVLVANVPVNSDIIRDQLIATDVLTMLQEHVEMLLVAIASATTNDDVRKIFINMVHKDLDHLSLAIKYFKLKGWLNVPPMYTQNQGGNTKIDIAEAFNLWSHLTYRYDNLQLTGIFVAASSDVEFRLFLKAGQQTLKRQIKSIENELKHFKIAFPVKPPAVRPPAGMQMADDDNMFRNIFAGMTGALSVHAKAVKQSTTNDRIRSLFSDLLVEEIDMLDKTIKYGKMKGWLNPAPSYVIFQ
jgi:spore coat protein CotF